MLISPFELVSEALECEQETLHENSGLNNHAAWDSMGHLTVLMALEKAYGVDINEESIKNFQTMSSIIDIYNSLQKQAVN